MKTFLACFGAMNLILMVIITLIHISNPLPRGAPGVEYLQLELFLAFFGGIAWCGVESIRSKK